MASETPPQITFWKPGSRLGALFWDVLEEVGHWRQVPVTLLPDHHDLGTGAARQQTRANTMTLRKDWNLLWEDSSLWQPTLVQGCEKKLDRAQTQAGFRLLSPACYRVLIQGKMRSELDCRPRPRWVLLRAATEAFISLPSPSPEPGAFPSSFAFL